MCVIAYPKRNQKDRYTGIVLEEEKRTISICA